MADKRIFIIGSGAIGRALAVFLRLTEKDVILLRGSEEVDKEYQEIFQVNLPEDKSVTSSIEVSSLNRFTQLHGIVVLTNKSFGNPGLAQRLKGKVDGSPVVLMQNGLDVETPFIELGFNQVYRCVLFATSQLAFGNQLRFRQVASSPIGIIKGSTDVLSQIIQALNSPHFLFEQVEEIQPIIWRKVIANCVFNSVCPLLDIDNGIFYRNEEALAVAKRIIKECVSIAKATVGVDLSEEEVLLGIVQISKASEGQFISTLQDIRHKRMTEIETLNFSVLKLAEKSGLGDLVRETRLLGELTRLKSDLSRGFGIIKS